MAFPLVRAGLVVAAVLVALLPAWLGQPVPEAPDAGAPAAGVHESASVLADAADLRTDAVAYLTLPAHAPDWQQTECDPKRREVKLPNGGCYKEQVGKPPCAEGEYLHDKKCWAAVAKRTRPAQSLSE